MRGFSIHIRISSFAILFFLVAYPTVGFSVHGGAKESTPPQGKRPEQAPSADASANLFKTFSSTIDPLDARRLLRDATDKELTLLKRKLEEQQAELSPFQQETLKAVDAVLATRELLPEETLSPFKDNETKEERMARSLLGERYYEQLGGDKKLSALLGANAPIQGLSTTQKLERLLNPADANSPIPNNQNSVLASVKNVKAIGPDGTRYPISQTEEGNWIKPYFDKNGEIDTERAAISSNGGKSYQVSKIPKGLSVNSTTGAFAREELKESQSPQPEDTKKPQSLSGGEVKNPPTVAQPTPETSQSNAEPAISGTGTGTEGLSSLAKYQDQNGNLFMRAPQGQIDNPEIKQKLYDAGLGLLAEGFTLKVSSTDVDRAESILNGNGLSSLVRDWVMPSSEGKQSFDRQVKEFGTKQNEAANLFYLKPTDGVKETLRITADDKRYQEGKPIQRFSPSSYSENVADMAYVGFSNAHYDFQNHYEEQKAQSGGKEPSIFAVLKATQNEYKQFEKDFGGSPDSKRLFQLGMASFYKVPTEQLDSYLQAKILAQLPQAPFMRQKAVESFSQAWGQINNYLNPLASGVSNPKR